MKSIVTTPQHLDKLAKILADSPVIAFDTETTGLEYDRELVGYSVATSADEGWYVPVGHKDPLKLDVENADFEHAISVLKTIFADPTKTIYIHNAKFDIKTIRNIGIDPDKIKAKVRDTMLIQHLLDPIQRKGLKVLIKKYFDYEMTEFKSLKLNQYKDDPDRFRYIGVSEMAPYAIDDARWLFKLAFLLEEKLIESGDVMCKIFDTLEMPMVFVIEEMEENGFMINAEYLQEASKNLVAEMVAISNEISSMIGGLQAHPSSSQWIGSTFIDKLQWFGVSSDWVKGKSGNFSTDASTLKEWASRKIPGTTEQGVKVAELLLRYRALQKLDSTYTLSLVNYLDKHSRIHASFNQGGTVTGRFSSSGPNLQNIPRPNENLPSIRKAFTARPDFVLVDVDYSQIELRLMAHFSQDPTMVEIYKTGGDIHQTTADACNTTRQHAKAINFGLIYGMGPGTLAASLGVDLNTAQKFHRRYFEKFESVKRYQDSIKLNALKSGYTTTLIGRRRLLPELRDSDWKKRGPAERQAVNTKIQGSAADLIKIAMRNIHTAFKKNGWFRKDAFMLSQVHDELIFEVRESMQDEIAKVIRFEMEKCVQLKVPLSAEPGFGPNWQDAK